MNTVHPLMAAALGLSLLSPAARAAWPEDMQNLAAAVQARVTEQRACLDQLAQDLASQRAANPAQATGQLALQRAGARLDREQAALLRLEAVLAVVNKAPPPKPDDPPPEAVLYKAAAEAQDKVDKLRERFKTAYDRGDGGTSTAVALGDYEDLGQGPARAAVGSDAKRWAQQAHELPPRLKASISKAQTEANALAAAALAYKAGKVEPGTDCRPGPTGRPQWLLDGVIAKLAFDAHHDEAKQHDEALSTAAFGLAVIKGQPNIPHDDLPKALAFRRLLEDNADVKSYFGGDAVGVTAGAADANLSFRYVMDFNGGRLNLRNRLSLIFSAPTNKDKGGVTTFADSADALKNLASVKLAWQLTNAPFKLPVSGTLNDFGVAIGAAQDTRSYYLPDSTNPNLATETKKNHTAVSLGIRWVFLMNPVSAYKTLLVLGHDSQRSFKNGDVQTRCPVDPATAAPGLVGCYTGAWGAPTPSYSRVVGIELRQHTPAFDIGLRLKQNLRTDKLDAELPLYLLRTHDGTAKKTPFSAGVVLSRSSGEPGLKWGLFVSLPLAFVRPER